MNHISDCNHSYTEKANYSYKKICNHSFMDTISKKIRELRIKKGLTPEQFAKNIGVSRVSVLKWENGSAQNLKIANILKICEFFGLTTDEFLKDESPSTLKAAEKAEPYRVGRYWPFNFPPDKLNLLPKPEIDAINEYMELRFFNWEMKSRKRKNAG
ncbi:Helix-turn-helix domain protein [Oxalobacter formigenes]|nr:Helix-turn-helix domain protein [Oxalobacter formigenes]QDX33160.1 helix-turn-helix domain-containing protein [Oxalobacter formigenes]